MNTDKFAILTVLLLALTACPLVAQQVERDRVVVSGEGTVSVDPDMATVVFGIVTRDDDANEARRQNESASREALDRLRDMGIPERQIQMQSLRLQPVRERNPETREMRDVGYEAIRILSVELDDIDLVPMAIAEVVQHGANRVEGVRYERRDRTEARNEALVAAAENAREKADVLAQALGRSLGSAVTIEERSYSFPRPMIRMEMASMEADQVADFDPGAYAVGEIEVTAEVQVTFALQ